MKKLKIILIALIMVMLSMFVLGVNNVYAVDRVLNRQDERPYSDDNDDWVTGNDYYQIQRQGPTLYRFVKIYDTNNVVTYDDPNPEDYDQEYTFENFIYCLRAGVGFGSRIEDEDNPGTYTNVTYQEIGEMHQNAETIINNYLSKYTGTLIKNPGTANFSVKTTNNVGEVVTQTKTVNLYNAILWIADNAYLPFDMNNYVASEYKDQLLDKIGVARANRGLITDDDIEVVQQLAIWYFANYDQNEDGSSLSIKSKRPFTGSAAITVGNGDENTLIPTRRAIYLDALYNYFINGAIENAEKYGTGSTRGFTSESFSLKKENLSEDQKFKYREKQGTGATEQKIIGPFIIEGQEGTTVSANSIYLLDKNGEGIDRFVYLDEYGIGVTPVYYILDENYALVSDTLNVGQKYYIGLYTIYDTNNNGQSVNGRDLYDFREISLILSTSCVASTAKFLATESENDQMLVELEKDVIPNEDRITTELPSKFTLNLGKIKAGSGLKNLLSGAKFKLEKGTWNGTKFTATSVIKESIETNSDYVSLIENQEISSSAEFKPGTYFLRLTEIEAPNGYIALENPIIIKLVIDEDFEVYATLIDSNGEQDDDGDYTSDYIEDIASISSENNIISIVVENKQKIFDLALRKFIVKVDDTELTEESSRVPSIDISPLEDYDDETTTANYIHPKDTLLLKRGTEITYKIRVYNEGNVDGKVTKITDYLPEGLKLVEGKNEGWVAGAQITLSDEETKVTPITKEVNFELPAYDSEKYDGDRAVWQKADYTVEDKELTGLYYADVEIVCQIEDTVPDEFVLKNVAEITGYEGGEDIDSQKENVYYDLEHNPGYEEDGYTPGEEDDDDFEAVEVKPVVFDLALRKYITGLEDKNGITKGIYNKEGNSNTRSLNNINTTPLQTGDTTASYKHRKDPVVVENGDIVTYTLRVYNEGDIDGYVTEITDILPEGVELYTYGLIPIKTGNPDKAVWKQEIDDCYIPGTTVTTTYSFDIVTRELTITRTYTHHTSIPDASPTIENYVFKLNAYNSERTENSEYEIAGDLADISAGKYGYYNGLNYGEISFKCKVTAEISSEDKVLTNIARITADRADIEGDKDDIDSDPEYFEEPESEEELEEYKGTTPLNDLSRTDYFYEGQEDDDDFEKLVILGKPFDLSLRKFITTINGVEVEESREPSLDMTQFEAGNTTTARYLHPKDALVVKQGDIVTYTIRVYNEGERAGYATEVTDYIPEGLGFLVGYNTNYYNNWKLEEGTTAVELGTLEDVYNSAINKLDVDDFAEEEMITSLEDVQIVTGEVKITTNLLQDYLIKAYDKTKVSKTDEDENWEQAKEGYGSTGLYYEDIEVACIVLAPNTYKGELKNIAAITAAEDENGVEIIEPGDDRDSEPEEINTDTYHNPIEEDGYWPGEQDDDDFEPLALQYFDLALRKFITGVNDTEITSRIPQLSYGEDGNIKYTHPKEEAPVLVENNDEVTYTIRIYNEGTKAGYADLVADDIPDGLEFLPENEVNKEYRWIMYKERDMLYDEEVYIDDPVPEGMIIIDGIQYVETDDPYEADIIQTDYLSKIQGASRMKEGDTKNPSLLLPFDSTSTLSDTNPDHADLKVVFRVTEPNNSQRVIVNSAQITHDLDERGREIDDEDSIPGRWIEGEDDQDKEYIKVKYFDLSLYKWVTKSIVTVDGATTTTETGFTPNIGKTENIIDMDVRDNSESEPIASVVLDKKKLSKTSVKFVYNIMIMNEGEIAGSATEITDYIPKGLEFSEEDNLAFGWEYAGDGKITTRCLDGLMLEPGEYATIEVVFRWINSSDNLGLKTNIAEISEDYNDSDTPDIDSIPDNIADEYTEEQEDDDDFALVILQLKTGSAPTYIALTISFLSILAGGTLLIKKYVL